MPIEVSQKQQNENVICVRSVFEEESLKTDPRAAEHLEYLLGAFAKEGKRTEEENAALVFFSENGEVGKTAAAHLTEAGILRGDTPSLADVCRAGENIILQGEDGHPLTFTERYFRCPLVRELSEKEAAGAKGCGWLLSVFMAVYFSEMHNPEVRNYRAVFGENTPEKVPAYFGNGEDPVMPIVDGTSHQELENSMDAYNELAVDISITFDQARKGYNEARKSYDAAVAEYKRALDLFRKNYQEAPKLSQGPREKNTFRRFFSGIGIVGHSGEYETERRAYREKAEEKQRYEEAEKELDGKRKKMDNRRSSLSEAEDRLNDASMKNKEMLQTADTGLLPGKKAVYVMRAMADVPQMTAYMRSFKKRQTSDTDPPLQPPEQKPDNG